MNKFIEFIKTRKLWYFLTFAASAIGLAGLILYVAAGRTQFDPNYNVETIVTLSFGTVFGIAALILDVRGLGRWEHSVVRACVFAQYICQLFACIAYITSQMNLIGNLAYNVDGSTFPVAFLILVIFTVLAVGLSLAAGILKKDVAPMTSGEEK